MWVKISLLTSLSKRIMRLGHQKEASWFNDRENQVDKSVRIYKVQQSCQCKNNLEKSVAFLYTVSDQNISNKTHNCNKTSA